MYLFKEDGTLLDEPGDFTPGGVQPLEGDNGFLNEWLKDLYCDALLETPTLVDLPPPRYRRAPPPATVAAAVATAIVITHDNST